MRYFKYWCCGILLSSFVLQISSQGCTIDIKNLPVNHPLFLSLNNDVIYPEPTTSTIIFKNDEEFELDCPGGGKVQADNQTFDRTVLATCVSKDLIYIGKSKIPINDVVCSKRITGTARFTSNICWKKYREIEVGFELPKQKFFRLFTSCFDDISRNVVYTTFQLTKEIGQQTVGNLRPGWTEGNFYNLSVKMDKIYPREFQRVTINRQLGLPDEDTTFVKSSGNYYLVKGHLVAKTDFIYDSEQQATFFYINSVPQWQTFNGQNWFYLERNLRNYAALKYINLTVYTGTYGISTLPHQATGEETELYFFEGDQEGPVIPIPALFWKVAYDPEHKAGVAVLGVNNPYQTNLENRIICNDISEKISWLNFEITKIESGYMYACTVADLRKVINDIPNLPITKLLTD